MLDHEDVQRIANGWFFFKDSERYPGEAGRLHDFLGWSPAELLEYERQFGKLAPTEDHRRVS